MNFTGEMKPTIYYLKQNEHLPTANNGILRNVSDPRKHNIVIIKLYLLNSYYAKSAVLTAYMYNRLLDQIVLPMRAMNLF